MPPLPVIADVFRVTLTWAAGGSRPAQNVMHFEAPGKDEGDVWTALNAHVTAGMWNWASSSVGVSTVDIEPLDGTSAATTHLTGLPAKWSGAGSGDVIPQVAGLIKLTSGLRGRSKRGRIYIPFVAEGQQAFGVLLDAAAVSTAWGTFANAMATDGVALGIASYKLSSWVQATTVTAETTAATQRRRLLR
jgi:hypothetical protein